MKVMLTCAVGIGILLLAMVSASAEELFTPPVRMDPEDQLICTIVNIGNKPVTIRAAACNYSGCGPTSDKSLAPGAVFESYYISHSEKTDARSSDVGYCKFTVAGNPNQVRASACFLFLDKGRTIAQDCMAAD